MLDSFRRMIVRVRLSLLTTTSDYLAVATASRNLMSSHGAEAVAEARRRRAEAPVRERLFWDYVEADLHLHRPTSQSEPLAGE